MNVKQVCTFACAALLALAAWADCYRLDAKGQTVTLDASTQINSTDRLLVYCGTLVLGEGASIICGGNDNGSCNFIGIDRGSAGGLTINGGTLWCSSAKGAGVLGVGNNDNGQTSSLVLNSGTLRVDTRLRCSTQWSGTAGAKSSGIVTVNGGEAIVKEFYLGASSSSSGTATLNLNGGVVTAQKITFPAYNGQALNLSGGRLVAAAPELFDVATYAGGKTRTLTVTAGKTTVFDTAGFSQTLPAELGGTGTLVLTGGGTVSFGSRAPTYAVALGGATLAIDATDAAAEPLALNLSFARGAAYPQLNALDVSLPASPAARVPVLRLTSSLGGAEALAHLTCAQGALSVSGDTLYLDLGETATDALVYSGAGGDVTPAGDSYTYLAFLDPTGAYTVGGDGFTLTDEKAIIASRSTAAQRVTAPIRASATGLLGIDVATGSLDLAGGLTANQIAKRGEGVLALGANSSLESVVLGGGTIDFGGATYTGKLLNLPRPGTNCRSENGAGRVVTCANGTWVQKQDDLGNLEFEGWEVHFGAGFNFAYEKNWQRIAIGYGAVGANTQHALILDEGCGEIILRGNENTRCNFVGVDQSGTARLVVNGGTLHVVRDDNGGGTMRVAAGGNPDVKGSVLVTGGRFIVDWDLTLATVYNGTSGGKGTGSFELTGGSASIAQLYLGGASASTGTSSIRLTGGDLSVKSLVCLAYNKQDLYADGLTIHALCDDGDRSVKFLEKRASADATARSYVVGPNGLGLDTAGYTVHASIPFTGEGQVRVSGGGNLMLGTGLAVEGGLAVTDATLTVPCYETYPSLVLAGDAKLAIDLKYFDGREDLLTISSGLVLPEGKTADDIAEFVSVVNGEGEVMLSDDMKTIRIAAANTIAFRHLKIENRTSTDGWEQLVFPPTAETLPKSDLGFLANGSNAGDKAWGEQYIAHSHNRIDGWMNVPAEEAGLWTIVGCIDDYITLDIDGAQALRNTTWNVPLTNTVEVAAGWHSFSIVYGDGTGGFGPSSGSPFPSEFPLGVKIGEGDLVKFDAANFAFGDPVAETAGDFVLDRAGDVQFYSLAFNEACRLVFDPTKTVVRLAAAPTFSAAGQLALAPALATATKGRYLLLNWDTGTLALPEGLALTDLFDATSAQGVQPLLTIETVGEGGRLWLDLDASATATPITVLPLGAAQGKDAWRAPFARLLAAQGYEMKTTGLRAVNPDEAAGLLSPAAWTRASLLAGERLRTTARGAGLDAALEALVDQAGADVDVVLLQIGANDFADGATADELLPVWCDVVNRLAALLPTTKIVWGAVTDLGDAAKNDEATRFNVLATIAVASETFPANQVFVADLASGSAASAWCAAVATALAAPAVPAQRPAVQTTQGVEANVPAAYRAGFKRARVYDAVVAAAGEALTVGGEVPYEDFASETGATDYLTRVGYYIELKRKNTDVVDYAGRVRWLWVDMDAFGADPGCVTIADVGVPVNALVRQQVVGRLHVVGNVPGVEMVAADNDTVQGFVEFWPNSYEQRAGGAAGAPAHLWGYDWNDTPTGGIYGSMQVHRVGGAAGRAGETLFAYNGFLRTDGQPHEIGLGTYADAEAESLDWTSLSVSETMNLSAYEVARIEVWTHSLRDEEDSEETVTAYWRGTASGDPADPANWLCYNAAGNEIANGLPGIHTTIRVNAAGAMNLQAPATSALAYRAFVVEGSLTLTDDTDWTLFGAVAIPDGTTIDLNGHHLFVKSLVATTAGEATVTDKSQSGGGTLHFNLVANETYTNGKLVFAGKMAFVLEGEGLFIPQLANQSYTGGTVVAGGTMRMCRAGTDNVLGPWGVTVRVDEGATFDVYGYTNYTAINLVLNGGTLANTRSGVWQSPGLGNVTLAADSFVSKPYDVTLWWDGYTLDLGGHTLTVQNGATQSFLMTCAAKNGTLVVYDSWFATYQKAVDARTVDLRMMDGAKFYLRTDLSVHDYYAASAVSDMSAINGQVAAKLLVYGTFTPVVDTFRGCELQNGATINLAEKSAAWEMKSNLSAANVVTFADGAQIGLDIGARKVTSRWQYVLTWGEHVPANLATLSFAVANEAARGVSVQADETGLKVARFGTVLFVR